MLTPSLIVERLADYEIGRWGSGMARSERISRGDHDLNPHMAMPENTKPAAVLVPLVQHDSEITVLLTQRTDHLKDHAGQVSFPGGRVEQTDADREAAALRETEEEVGISSERIKLIGKLDMYITRTGYEVTPVVGLVKPPFDVAPDPYEVADVFEVPLGFLMDPANHQRMSKQVGGVSRHFYAIEYGERFIWGATAGMLVNLSELLAER